MARCLERTPLVGTFLDSIDLEDDQKQAQKREVPQKGAQAATAVFGLADIEASLPAPWAGSSATGVAGKYCWWGARFGLGRTEFWLLVPIGNRPFSAFQIYGRRVVPQIKADSPVRTTPSGPWPLRRSVSAAHSAGATGLDSLEPGTWRRVGLWMKRAPGMACGRRGVP